MSTVHLAGSALSPPRHVCAFFHSDEQPSRIFNPFRREGLDHGDKVIDIVDPRVIGPHERMLAAAGLMQQADDRRARARGAQQLEVQGWDQNYLKDGYFDVERQLGFVESTIVQGKAEGHPMTRFVASMEWALEPRPGVEKIVEYEARLSTLMTRYEDAAICSFDLSRFNAALIVDIMRAHPMVLLAGRVYLNPFFVAPNRLLAELRERKTPGS